MGTLFDSDIKEAGYRLNYLEIYNWGTFDKKIWRLNPNCKNSLLTGANGSGKTTIVDAIATLLVPPEKRFYNQSSGEEKKRERNEKSYFFGEYGNLRDEEAYSSTKQNLRAKDDYSILLGTFSNKGEQNHITLAQVRWFSSNELKKAFIISPGQLTIDEHFNPIDSKGEWKKRIKTVKNTTIYDSFLQYSNAFSKIFGLKSEKALSLFSHTIGVKVLGNLNDFIRENMFEKIDMESEYSKLKENYDNLLSVYNEIEKAEEQLKLLEPIVEKSERYGILKKELIASENIRDSIPLWFAREENRLLNDAIDLNRKNYAILQNRIGQIDEELKDYEKRERDLDAAIQSDESSGRINIINEKIDSTNRELDDKKKRLNVYSDIAVKLNYNDNPDETFFYKQAYDAESRIQQIDKENSIQWNNQSDLKNEIQKSEEEIKNILDEIESLQKRKNRIPRNSIEIRAKISESLEINENELPFIGELIRVNESDKEWEYAIEKLLHNFALRLIVPDKNYKAVNKYVNDNNLKGRIVYHRVRKHEFFDNGQRKFILNSVMSKLEIKANSPYYHWIIENMLNHFSHICLKSVDDFVDYEKALTKEGLIKTKDHHEKDDRAFRINRENYILGWDNTETLKMQKQKYNNLEKDLVKKKESSKLIEDNLNKSDVIKSNLIRFTEFKNYNEINVKQLHVKIQELHEEKKLIQSKSDKLNELIKQHEKIKISIVLKKKDRDQILQESGAINDKITRFEKKLVENKTNEMNFHYTGEMDSIPSLEKMIIEKINLDNLQNIQDRLHKEISHITRIKTEEKSKIEKELLRLMRNFIRPDETTNKRFPGWQSETRDFRDDMEYLDDFIKKYNQITSNDLPKYKKKFKDFLNENMILDIASFKETLEQEEQNIRNGIKELNDSLNRIAYNKVPETYIKLHIDKSSDQSVIQFREMLKDSLLDTAAAIIDETLYEKNFMEIKRVIEKMSSDDTWRKKVTDVRNWMNFYVAERYRESDEQKQYYEDSTSLSGGEKAKLTYTILASAIAYQYNIDQKQVSTESFRFIVIDEAFSKVDPDNALFALDLFSQLNLQVMIVTPADKINIAEKFIDSVHYAEKKNGATSSIYNLTITEYSDFKKEFQKKEMIHDNAG